MAPLRRRAAHRQRARQITPGLWWLGATVFLLCAVPRLGMRVGPVPLYVIDLPAVMAFWHALNLGARFRRQPMYTDLILVIVLFMTVGELAAIGYFPEMLQPIYALGRALIAVSVFYSAAVLIRASEDVLLLVKAATAGMLFTAVVMILSSFPATRGLTTTYLFSNPFLEPAAEQTVDMYSSEIEAGVRGRSLVGVSILSGTFINLILPLGLMLYQWPERIGHWRQIALAACLVAPLGVLTSYSRGAILGTALIVCAIVAVGARRTRTVTLAAIGATAVLVLAVGVQSDLFMFDRLENRTAAMFDESYSDERESERIMAYVEPFEHVMTHPQFLLVGEGSIAQRLSRQAEQRSAATHAIFAKGYYSYGMVAGFLYLALPFILLARLMALRVYARRHRLHFLEDYSSSLVVMMAALLPWLIFGHAAITEARGAMMLFLIVGLVASTRNFVPARAPSRLRPAVRPPTRMRRLA